MFDGLPMTASAVYKMLVPLSTLNSAVIVREDILLSYYRNNGLSKALRYAIKVGRVVRATGYAELTSQPRRPYSSHETMPEFQAAPFGCDASIQVRMNWSLAGAALVASSVPPSSTVSFSSPNRQLYPRNGNCCNCLRGRANSIIADVS